MEAVGITFYGDAEKKYEECLLKAERSNSKLIFILPASSFQVELSLV